MPQERRKEAAEAIRKQILARYNGMILSYWSFGTELDLTSLNQILASEKRLLLPGIQSGQMLPYLVKEPATQLHHYRARILEPDPAQCQVVETRRIDVILVPGLAFDRERYRLGYGEGWYDRFLAQGTGIHSVGVGFTEQLSASLLPRDPWDRPVQELLLT